MFFDSVDYEWLMNFLKVRISNPNNLRLVKCFLRTGIMKESKHYELEKGTPQGGILSPLLANIYLHFCLDIRFKKVIKKKNKRFWRLIRYGDDFAVCFQKAIELEAFGKAL
jgi:retron-type reverse transcriptase